MLLKFPYCYTVMFLFQSLVFSFLAICVCVRGTGSWTQRSVWLPAGCCERHSGTSPWPEGCLDECNIGQQQVVGIFYSLPCAQHSWPYLPCAGEESSMAEKAVWQVVMCLCFQYHTVGETRCVYTMLSYLEILVAWCQWWLDEWKSYWRDNLGWMWWWWLAGYRWSVDRYNTQRMW